jgi:hypothetical protein
VGRAMQKASGPGVVKLDGLTRVWDELELGRKEKKMDFLVADLDLNIS